MLSSRLQRRSARTIPGLKQQIPATSTMCKLVDKDAKASFSHARLLRNVNVIKCQTKEAKAADEMLMRSVRKLTISLAPLRRSLAGAERVVVVGRGLRGVGVGRGLWQAACLPHLEHVGHVTSRWMSHTLIEKRRQESRHAVRWMRKRRV